MELTLDTEIPYIFLVGMGLSVVTVALVLAAFIDIWRRKTFPKVAYGGITLTVHRMKWIWGLTLLGAFGFGVNEDPITTRSFSSGNLEVAQAAGPVRTVSVDLPMPFYQYHRARYSVAGEVLAEEGWEGFGLPWPLLSALFAYWVLVLHWNPGNRFARRILQGRRWRNEADGTEERPQT